MFSCRPRSRCVLALALVRPCSAWVAISRTAGRRSSTLTMQEAPPLTLHCKAGPDQTSYGDCPFAHAVRLCLETKSLSYNLEPHGPDNKPAWLLEGYGGKMPALEIGSGADRRVVTESRTIAEEIDRLCPSPSLSPEGLEAGDAAAADVFPAMAGYVKNTDAARVDELKKPLLLALCKLDAHLASSGSFVAGEQMSMADCFLVPKLYHMQIVAAHFHGFEVPPQFEALQAYMSRTLESVMFRRTAPVPPMVKWGWANARGNAAEIERAAAEALAAD